MKNTRLMKKVATIATAALMTACIAVPMATGFSASAATITINGISATQAHTFEVYQIFSGTLGTNDELSEIKWAAGIAAYDGTAVTVGDSVSKSIIDSLDISKIALSSTKACDDVVSDAGTASVTGLADGYYVVKDVTDLTGKDDANSTWIVQVAGDAEITIKNAKPSVDKQVWDETADAESGAVDGWGESADHAINETFQFKLTADMPTDSDLDSYDEYQLIFTDTMSDGVTFEKINSVTVAGAAIDAADYSCTATAGQAGGSWTLTIPNLKDCLPDGITSISNADVVVIYDAHLNESAKIGNNDSNKNTVGLQYSNNPEVSGAGSSELGQTPDDTVWVFTYEMQNTKVDQTNTPLAGAGFRLYDTAGTEISLIYDDTLAAYRPIKSGETGVEMVSAASTGKFDIKGLDAGSYVLKETTVPEGYNKCDDVSIEISATHIEADAENTATTAIVMTVDGADASAVTVVNKFGSTLPSTGGIGTTIFYVVGGLMVAGSGVYLISKKRMSNKEEQ